MSAKSQFGFLTVSVLMALWVTVPAANGQC